MAASLCERAHRIAQVHATLYKYSTGSLLEACAMSNELKPLHFDADYTMEEALAEAKRCLNCPKPLCRMGCPIENEIPRFIKLLRTVTSV